MYSDAMSSQTPREGGPRGSGPGPAHDEGIEPGRTPGVVEIRSDWGWPAAIAAGLLLVVIVNVVFIWVAVSNADPVVPSYIAEER